ncbi:Putative AC9 transposase [Linum perenne]
MDSNQRGMEAGVNTQSDKHKVIEPQPKPSTHKRIKGNSVPPIPKQNWGVTTLAPTTPAPDPEPEVPSPTPPTPASSTSSCAPLPATANSTSASSASQSTHKTWSSAWTVMVKFFDEHENKKTKCNICQKVLATDPTLNGTSTCKNHALQCIAKRDAKNGQTTLIMKKSSTTKGEGTPDVWRFNQAAVKLALAEIIIVDELPFSFVEHRGFKHFIEVCCLEFRIPSRRAIREDCFGLFIDEHKKLREYLKTAYAGRVSTTTDTWTSVQDLITCA